jgi:hypothetical protein
MQLTSLLRPSLLILAALFLVSTFTNPARAQSTRFDEPAPIGNGAAEGVLPGGKAAHYWACTVGPGEVNISYVFVSNGIATVGAQVTDINGRVVIDLNQREKYGSWAGDEITEVLGSGSSTLSGRYNIPRRQTVVVKVFVDGDKTPYNYRISVRAQNVAEPGPGSPTGLSTPLSGHEPNSTGSNANVTAGSTTRRPASSTWVKPRPNSCLDQYQTCLKRSIISKAPGATSQCIIQRSYCEQRSRNTARSGSTPGTQGEGKVAGKLGTVQQGAELNTKKQY